MALRKERSFIEELEQAHQEIEGSDRVRHLLNVELFYHAAHELPDNIPN